MAVSQGLRYNPEHLVEGECFHHCIIAALLVLCYVHLELYHFFPTCCCPLGEFHVFDAAAPELARASTPSLRPFNDADERSRKFTLDFAGTPGISKRLGQKGNNKD